MSGIFPYLIFACTCCLSAACKDGTETERNVRERNFPPAPTVRYEAEQARLVGGSAVGNGTDGYSGDGYVRQNAGDLYFTVEVPADGWYCLTVRYNTLGHKKENLIEINGMRSSYLIFDAVDGWRDLIVNQVKFNRGSNEIGIIKAWGWMLFDYIEISAARPSPDWNIAALPVHPAPSAEVVNVYRFLVDNFGRKTLSGAMANYSTGLEEAEWMFEKTGLWPALTCFDLIDHTRSYDFCDKEQLLFNAQKYWIHNGLVALMWHWRDPSGLTEQFYTDSTPFDISKIYDTGSAEYKAVIRDIDTVAVYLKKLQALNIPVLWRPLHEASGGWFWWGARGAGPCKLLWKVLYERLTHHHGLDNLLWVWTTDNSPDSLD